MDKKMIVPASTFLTGFFTWLIYILLHRFVPTVKAVSPTVDLGFCLLVSILIVISAISCKLINGPRIGAIIRSSVLTVFSIISYFLLGTTPAILLLVGALIILPIAFMTYEKQID